MLASGLFEVPALAFSQQIPYPSIAHDETLFRTAAEWLPRLLTFPTPQRGMCWSINFPAFTVNDLKLCDISMYSRFHPSIQRHNKTEGGDTYELEQGYITCVPLRLEAITWHGPALDALGNSFIKEIMGRKMRHSVRRLQNGNSPTHQETRRDSPSCANSSDQSKERDVE
jgi:hypothetical protein